MINITICVQNKQRCTQTGQEKTARFSSLNQKNTSVLKAHTLHTLQKQKLLRKSCLNLLVFVGLFNSWKLYLETKKNCFLRFSLAVTQINHLQNLFLWASNLDVTQGFCQNWIVDFSLILVSESLILFKHIIILLF